VPSCFGIIFIETVTLAVPPSHIGCAHTCFCSFLRVCMWRQQNTHTLPLSPPTYFPPEPFWRRLTTGQLNGGSGGGKAATRRELWPIETSNKTQAQQEQQLTQSVCPFSSFSPLHIHTPLFSWVSGRSFPAPFFPARLQFLLYDFILSSFYAFFMPLRCGFLTLLADKSTNWATPWAPNGLISTMPLPWSCFCLSSSSVCYPAALFMHYLVGATIIGCRTV